ncbi:MAG: hypothetical protein SGPRY_011301, partial [Prymnesium sp.]
PNPRGGGEDDAAMRQSKFCLAPHGTGFGMRQFDALAAGCVPLIIRVRWEDCKNNGGLIEQVTTAPRLIVPLLDMWIDRKGSSCCSEVWLKREESSSPFHATTTKRQLKKTLDFMHSTRVSFTGSLSSHSVIFFQAFEDVLPWASFSLFLNRSQIPQLASILRSFPSDRLASLHRGIACVWPRLFWLHHFSGSEPDLEPISKACSTDCRRKLQALLPFDAFGTFLWLLTARLQKPRQPPAFALPSTPHTPWLLRGQPWLTSAESCNAALAMEKQLETSGRLPRWASTLRSHGMW